MATERAERWDKIDLKPKRWWGYTILLFILGTLLPPLGMCRSDDSSDFPLTCFAAVAARFGIGKDFWTNVVLTLCGYIPGKLIFACRIELAVSETEARSRPQLLHTGAI